MPARLQHANPALVLSQWTFIRLRENKRGIRVLPAHLQHANPALVLSQSDECPFLPPSCLYHDGGSLDGCRLQLLATSTSALLVSGRLEALETIKIASCKLGSPSLSLTKISSRSTTRTRYSRLSDLLQSSAARFRKSRVWGGEDSITTPNPTLPETSR